MLGYRRMYNTLTHLSKNACVKEISNLFCKRDNVPVLTVHQIRSLSKTPIFAHSFTAEQNPNHDVIEDTIEEDKINSKHLIEKVNDHIVSGSQGRLFAVIQILGKQYKITQEDLLLIEHNWAPTVYDQIRLEKVLLVGGANFTLIGRPVLPRNVVNITATIIQKDLTHTKFRYYYIAKRRTRNLNFIREQLTYLRINKIEVYPNLNVVAPPSEIHRV